MVGEVVGVVGGYEDEAPFHSTAAMMRSWENNAKSSYIAEYFVAAALYNVRLVRLCRPALSVSACFLQRASRVL